MSQPDYQREFYLNLDEECQKLVDNCYTLLGKLKHYEENYSVELPIQYQKLMKNLHNMLTNYEESNL